MFNDPSLGGGIRPVSDVFQNYLKAESKNIELLVEYARQLGNGAVFKRLGFLLEHYLPDATDAISACISAMTKGNSNLDPSLPCERLVTKWRLWIPENWVKEKDID